jgi:hypothetical protein
MTGQPGCRVFVGPPPLARIPLVGRRRGDAAGGIAAPATPLVKLGMRPTRVLHHPRRAAPVVLAAAAAASRFIVPRLPPLFTALLEASALFSMRGRSLNAHASFYGVECIAVAVTAIGAELPAQWDRRGRDEDKLSDGRRRHRGSHIDEKLFDMWNEQREDGGIAHRLGRGMRLVRLLDMDRQLRESEQELVHGGGRR